MDKINETFAANLMRLRNEKNLTQLELGEKLNYSDKAVSRWERGEAIPDARVLVNLSEIFGVTIDDMLKRTNLKPKTPLTEKFERANRVSITTISFFGVWTVAVLTFIILSLSGVQGAVWLPFVYALPLSIMVVLIFSSIWGNRIYRCIVVSLFIWSIIFSIYLSVLCLASKNWWILFILGAPAQIVVLSAFHIRKVK